MDNVLTAKKIWFNKPVFIEWTGSESVSKEYEYITTTNDKQKSYIKNNSTSSLDRNSLL